MHIDLVNWFEIAAAATAFLSYTIKPSKIIAVLSSVLFITLLVEFTAKYLNQMYFLTKSTSYTHRKFVLYSLFNIVKFCGFSWFIYTLLNDVKHIRLYIACSVAIVLFVTLNFTIGQGSAVYNNFSAAFGTFCLVALILVKFRSFDNLGERNKSVYVFLATLFFYYSICLPYYLLLHEMIKENRSEAVKNFALIVDGANYFFYSGLTLATILHSLSTWNSKRLSLNIS
jgi:hypothetical protein